MNWQVQVGEETTSAAVDLAPNGDRSTVFVCAHGAGGNMADNGVRTVSRTLGERGVDVVRFNFLYKEKKSSRPDPMPRLEATTERKGGPRDKGGEGGALVRHGPNPSRRHGHRGEAASAAPSAVHAFHVKRLSPRTAVATRAQKPSRRQAGATPRRALGTR